MPFRDARGRGMALLAFVQAAPTGSGAAQA